MKSENEEDLYLNFNKKEQDTQNVFHKKSN